MRTACGFLLPIAAITLMSTPALAQKQVTFTKDVAPIFQEHCQVCHRAGTIAPMSLLTYPEVRPWARSIKLKVAAREMPPWFIDKNVGVQHFDNDISLTDQEIATIVTWVDGGALQGSPADMPPPRQFPDEHAWQIGQPDLVLTLPKDVMVPAHGSDWWPDVLIDPKLTEDRYIKAIQIIPAKGYDTIHHILTSIVPPDDDSLHSGQLDANAPLAVGEQGVFLDEYAIGKGADVFGEGSGRLIKAGNKINFQFHLHPSGEETPVNVTMGLKFYPKGYTPQHTITSERVSASADIDIRPNEANARTDGYLSLVQPTRLLSFQPHMHRRGKAECLEAIYPNLKRETLSCARFEFNWMVNYVYAYDEAPLLPAGTILHSIMWHDNSAENKANPDPDAQIVNGSRTVDEMSNTWLSWVYMSEEDFKKETEARKAKQQTLTKPTLTSSR